LLAVWEISAKFKNQSYVLPEPALVGQAAHQLWVNGHVLEAILNSLRRAALGYALSLVAGTLLGIAIARIRMLRLALASMIGALQILPSVVWVPIGVLWFGLNETAVYFIVVMGALPSITGGTVAALDNISPLLLRVGRSMGARGPALYRHVVLSAALPGYIAGLKQAWAFSWRSLMAAELIATGPTLGLGLGQLLREGGDLSDMSVMLAVVIMILIVGLTVEELVFAPIDRGIRSRRGLTGS
jgi:NitT/TauT family transport system permease protein